MSYATLMVHVSPDGPLDPSVRFAIELADRFQSHLIGVSSRLPPPGFIAEGVAIYPEATESDRQELKARLDCTGGEFRVAAEKRGLKCVEWRSFVDSPTETIVREARAADLVILGRAQSPFDEYYSIDIGSVLLNAGRPVVVVPHEVNPLAGRRVAIAWKDTREARRAVADALPFLHEAEVVILLEVCEWGNEAETQQRLRDVAGHLHRHRVTATAERPLPRQVDASAVLLKALQDHNIDLLVAGAYGHSRLGEWMFGGVTRDLMAKSPVCCLFSH